MSTRPDKPTLSSVKNQQGFGLIAAVFLIVVIGMFGVLIARYVATTSISSAEDYLSAQSLFSARSAASLRILFHDSGGPLGWVWTDPDPEVAGFATTRPTDNFVAAGTPAVIRTRATSNAISGISRDVEIKYIL